MKTFIKERGLAFFLIAVVLLWIKTYVGYVLNFNLGIDNTIQKILLFVNPLRLKLVLSWLWTLVQEKITADSHYSDSFFNVFFTVRKHCVLQIFQ